MANQSPKQILQTLVPQDWDDPGKPNSGFARVRALQDLSDVIARPLNNRSSASTSGVAVNCNGAVQSTGIGTANPITPKVYGETTVQARVTLSASAAGAYEVFVYRTTGNIPAKGAGPNAGDVVVGGGSFGGGSLAAGVSTPATVSVIDEGLSQSVGYSYYLAISGPNGDTLTLTNGSQLVVSEA